MGEGQCDSSNTTPTWEWPKPESLQVKCGGEPWYKGSVETRDMHSKFAKTTFTPGSAGDNFSL